MKIKKNKDFTGIMDVDLDLIPLILKLDIIKALKFINDNDEVVKEWVITDRPNNNVFKAKVKVKEPDNTISRDSITVSYKDLLSSIGRELRQYELCIILRTEDFQIYDEIIDMGKKISAKLINDATFISYDSKGKLKVEFNSRNKVIFYSNSGQTLIINKNGFDIVDDYKNLKSILS